MANKAEVVPAMPGLAPIQLRLLVRSQVQKAGDGVHHRPFLFNRQQQATPPT